MTSTKKPDTQNVSESEIRFLNDPSIPHFSGLWQRDLDELNSRADKGVIAWPTAFLFLGNCFMLRFSLHPMETRKDDYLTSHMLWHYRATPAKLVMTPYFGDDERPFDTLWRRGKDGSLETRFAGDVDRPAQESWFRYLPDRKWSELVEIGFDPDYMITHVEKAVELGLRYKMTPGFPNFSPEAN
jgi:hypothetical protein